MMISEPFTRALARVIDLDKAGSFPVKGRLGVRTPWRARLTGSRKPGLEVIAKVRLAQYLQRRRGRLKAQTRSDPRVAGPRPCASAFDEQAGI